MSYLSMFKTILKQVECDRSDKETLCCTLNEEKARIKKYKEMIKECEKDIDYFQTRISELKMELNENKELIEKYNSCSKKLLNSTDLIKTALVTVEEYALVYEKKSDFDHKKRVDLIEINSKHFQKQLNEYQQSPEAVECKNLEKSIKKLRFEYKYLNHEIESRTQIKESLENMKRTILFIKAKKLYETLKMTYKHIEIDQKIRHLKPLYEKKLQETTFDYNANEIIPMEICSQKTDIDIPSDLSEIKSLELNIDVSDFTNDVSLSHPLSEIQSSSQKNANLDQNSYINAIYKLYEDYLSINTDDYNDELKMTSEFNSKKTSIKKPYDESDKENMNRKKICTEQSKNVEMNKIGSSSNDNLMKNNSKPKLISDQIINLSMEMDLFDLTSLQDDKLIDTEMKQPQKSITIEEIHNVDDKIITDDQISDLHQSIDFNDMKDDDQESLISSLQSIKSFDKLESDFQDTPVENTYKTTEKSVVFNSTQSRPLAFFNKQSSETNNNMFNFMGSKQTKQSFF